MEKYWMFFTTFSTSLIAVFGCYIAYQQFRLGRDKFKHELFEKRFAVFAGTRLFLSQILRDGKLELQTLFEFRGATAECSFLFGDDITSYIAEIDSRALEMKKYVTTYASLPSGEERSKLVHLESEELKWLIDQLPALKDRFAPYLKFNQWS